MLAQTGGRASQLPRGGGELIRSTRDRAAAERGVLERGEESPGREMWRGEKIAEGGHGSERNPPLLGRVVEVHDGLLAAPFLEKDLQRIEVLAARQTILEQLEARPLRSPHQLDELPPLVLLDAADEDPSVAALHEAEGLDRLGAEPRGDEAAVRKVLVGQLENSGHAFL